MINLRQLDRLVLKIVRLKDFYAPYIVKNMEEQEVTLDGKLMKKGEFLVCGFYLYLPRRL